MDFNPNDYTAVGKLLKPFAVKGEIKVMPLTFDLNRHTHLQKVYIQSPQKETEVIELTIDSVRVKQDTWFIKFEEIDTPEEGKRYNSWAMLIPNEDRLPLEEGEFYLSDLEGFTMITDNGITLGPVIEVIEYPSVNSFHVKYNSEDIMAPWLDECVLNIDEEKKTITVSVEFLSATYEFLNEQ